jgi:DNA polymerase III subunit alpha
MAYASLHNHSDYSNIKVIDSINKIENLMDEAFKKGLYAVALTDHDTLSGHIKAIQYYNEAYKDKEFKLILGNEIYIAKEGLNDSNYQKGDKFNHFLILAKDEIGHKQLREISSRAWDRSFTKGVLRTPTYISDLKEILGRNPGHLISTTACLGGVTGNLYQSFAREEDAIQPIKSALEELRNIFGPENFYIEVQPSSMQDQISYNKFMIKHFWNDYPFVFTTDSHYLDESDRELHSQFLNSKDDGREVDQYYSSAFIMTYEKVSSYFDYIESDKMESMRLNTIKIADMVTSYDLHSPQIVPTVPVNLSADNEQTLKNLSNTIDKKYDYIHKYLNADEIQDRYFIYKIFQGMQDKIINITDEYYERLEYELEQVWETSVAIKQPLSKYFVTMAHMIDIIWNEGDSFVGVSRGSAAGFLLNYCLGITQLDPLSQALELPPWRFIHKDRPGLPDIDIDTEGNKRVRTFNKVQEYFKSIGGDLVNVCTFGTEKSKSAIRTAGRGLGIDDETISYIVSMVPNERGFDWTLSQCMYGDEDHVAIPKFQEEMAKNKKLWTLASKIEGLITRIGVHASGVIALNEDITEHNSLMKTSRGVAVTAYNLEDTEYAGGLKYDFLTINGLDKIRTTINLLLEDGVIDWEGDLRSTYNRYLLPSKLDYTSEDMWRMVHENKIVDLFQFDTPVGVQAVKQIKPKNIAELSVANSIMRLMSDNDEELPLDTYVRFKNDLRSWYTEMRQHGLKENEIQILEKYLKVLSGVADTQESVMLLTMDPKISNFTVTEANSLRKAIAKKKFDVLEKTKKMFFEKGKEIGTSRNLLDYVWNIQIMRQAGYSFSVLHTMGYSTIALQEMNLAYKFPIIYWNTACLSVNSGAVNEEDFEALIEDGIIELEEDDENKREANKVQYGKVAAAISKFRDNLDLTITLPDINRARFGFTPDADKNEVLFGLKGITRIGDDLIRTIISKRPFTSLENFLEKMTEDDKKLISKEKVVMLIKAGAFDVIEKKPREEILMNYIKSVADQKNRITLQNVAMLIGYNMIPDDLDFERKVYNFTKYIRKSKLGSNYYKLDDTAQSFYYENFDPSMLEITNKAKETITAIEISKWDKIYDSYMDNIRKWITDNHDDILKSLNEILFEEEYQKYAAGNILSWELDSLNFYHSGHELANIESTLPINIDSIENIPDREVIGFFQIKGKKIPKYQIRHVIGTVLDKDKQKHLVTLSTPHGIVSIKIYRAQFSSYDKVVIKYNEDGEKEIVQDSFFKKGTFLLVSGIKDGDLFIPKVYKEHQIDPILMFEIENDKFKKAYEKVK